MPLPHLTREQAEDLAQRLLKREHDPNQPRVPAGHPHGGRWTKGAAPSAHQRVTQTGEATVSPGLPSSKGRTASPTSTAWTDFLRNTEASPQLASSADRDPSPAGTDWTDMLRDADVPLHNVGIWDRAIRMAWPHVRALFTLLAARNTADSIAVLELRARDYQGRTGQFSAGTVMSLTRAEAEAVCPLLPTVQQIADKAAASVNPLIFNTPQKYGTEVHRLFAQMINALKNWRLKAEVSVLKTAAPPILKHLKNRSQGAHYGESGSLRYDATEAAPRRTLCLHELKTGEAELTDKRADLMWGAAISRMPNLQRIIVTEVRPSFRPQFKKVLRPKK